MADHALRLRYLAPLVTPAAILLSTRAGGRPPPRAWVRAAGVVVVLMGYVTFAITETTLNPSFRLIEVERVADAIYGRGVSDCSLALVTVKSRSSRAGTDKTAVVAPAGTS